MISAHGAGWVHDHGQHAVLILVPVLAFALVAAGADLRAWMDRRGAARPSSGMFVAAAFSAVAALIHGLVAPEHFHEARIYGTFFAVSTVGQLAWSVLAVTRNDKWLPAVGLVGNAACVLLWAVTRSIGIPLGPEAGEVEAVGVLDVLCATAEIGVVALCAMAIGQHVHPWRTQRRNGCATPSSSG
jgi:hypothetical protein